MYSTGCRQLIRVDTSVTPRRDLHRQPPQTRSGDQHVSHPHVIFPRLWLIALAIAAAAATAKFAASRAIPRSLLPAADVVVQCLQQRVVDGGPHRVPLRGPVPQDVREDLV